MSEPTISELKLEVLNFHLIGKFEGLSFYLSYTHQHTLPLLLAILSPLLSLVRFSDIFHLHCETSHLLYDGAVEL